MNHKGRVVYLILGSGFLLMLLYELISSIPGFNAKDVLKYSVPSLLFYFAAYLTYPVETFGDKKEGS